MVRPEGIMQAGNLGNRPFTLAINLSLYVQPSAQAYLQQKLSWARPVYQRPTPGPVPLPSQTGIPGTRTAREKAKLRLQDLPSPHKKVQLKTPQDKESSTTFLEL